MTRLSININKVALIRNARGANFPNLIDFARKCEEYGAQGITVHPRPDERHIKFSDLRPLKDIVTTEFNIEGYPSQKFIDIVLDVNPHQVTLVPDPPGALTSDSGWDTIKQQEFLTDVIGKFKKENIRVSLFLNPEPEMVDGAVKCGIDRIELYTGVYAQKWASLEGEKELEKHQIVGKLAMKYGLGINAGHDLNLNNLTAYKSAVSGLLEVSIGHAIVVDSLEFGLRNTILMYLNALNS